MSQTARRIRPWPVAILAALLLGPAPARAAPGDRLPPDAAATPGTDNSSVGSTSQVPNVAYPQAPVATPAAEGADRARPPTEREKEEQKLR